MAASDGIPEALPNELPHIDPARRPTVLVSDLQVDYRVFVAGKRMNNPDAVVRGGLGTSLVHALRGVSFVAYEGESIGVIGHNGSGKSTLMKAIAGLVPPARGAVYASARPSLLGVGAALIPQISGEKNITLGTLALGMTPAESRAAYQGIVDFTEMEEYLDLPMRTYSSGMTARLKFGIAMAKSHSILLIDEALSVGDKSFKSKSEERIREARGSAGTVFLVSHSMRSIMDSCERTIWIDHGRLVMDGPSSEVVDTYKQSTKGL